MYRVICTRSDRQVSYFNGTARECYEHCVPADLSHVHLKLYSPVLRELTNTQKEPVLVSYNENEPLLYTYHIQFLAQGTETPVPAIPYPVESNPKIERPTQDGERVSTSQGPSKRKRKND